jgi:exonuclease SbcC
MLLKKIVLDNIRSYKKQEVEFPIGSTLLSGDIGSGKTSILLAIEFALFGLQPGQRGSSLLRNGEDTGGAIIEFQVDENEVIVERTLKRGKSISQDYCAITLNGEKSEISVTELKNKVLELLNYPKEFSKKQNILYKFTVYTPQEEMKQIILQDSETRINTLRHVFGIDKYKKILENISIVTSKIREERRIKESLTGNFEIDKEKILAKEEDLKSQQYNIILVEEEFSSKKEQRKKIEEEKAEIYKKIEEKHKLQQEIEKTKIMILNKKDTWINNSKLIEQINSQIKELQELNFDEEKISQIEQEIIVKKNQKDKLNEINLEINSKITSINLKNEDNKTLQEKISSLEVCPTCLQNVDALYRANVLNKIHNDNSGNKNKLEELEQEKQTLYEKIKQMDLEISSKQKDVTDLRILKVKLQGAQEKQLRLQEIEKSNLALEKDGELLKQHIETLNSSVFELGRYDRIFEAKQKELEEALSQERITEIKVAELRKEIGFVSIQIKELKEKLAETEEIKKQLNYLIKLENWLSKKFIPLIAYIEKNVMIRLKTEFSKLFSEWFAILVPDTFHVRLSDDFTPVVEQQDYEIDYAYLSGGERTAIALAYRLSLNQVINSVLSKIKTKDLVILDEPTDGFSEQQLDKMRDVLQELDVAQLIIVSHEQKIEGFVENVIRFKKQDGVSQRD